MPILNDILQNPIDINALLQRQNLERKLLLDSVFHNFMRYATVHWKYSASSNSGGDDLLNGTATSVPCGGIATALKNVLIQGAVIPAQDIEYIRITGYVWTGWEYSCFDPTVRGNIFTPDDNSYHHGCIFSEHYYLKCDVNLFYDPCLNRSYFVRDQSVKERIKGPRSYEVGTGTNRRKLLYAERSQMFFLYQRDRVAQGFSGSWLMFPAKKKDLEKALGSDQFKSEIAVRGGTSEFAKLVKTLK